MDNVGLFRTTIEIRNWERQGSWRALPDTLDYRTSFRTLARLLVPTLSEIAIIDLLEEDGSSQRAAVAHTDETREALLFELHQDYAQLRPAHPLAQVLRSVELPEGSASTKAPARATKKAGTTTPRARGR